jgi:hypothetical protein
MADWAVAGVVGLRPDETGSALHPRLGRPAQGATAGPPGFGWYVTAERGRYRRTGDSAEWTPTSQRHLKRLGLLHTACGLSTDGWRVIWQERPLDGHDACERCLGLMGAARHDQLQ